MANERCHDVRVQLARLLRGEVDSAELAEMFHHLAECAGCAAEFKAEAALGRQLQAETTRYAPPPDIREAVENLIRRQRSGRWAAGRDRVQAFFRRPLVAAAVGALAASLFAVSVSQVVWQNLTPDALQSLVAEAANTHRRMVLQRELLDREQPNVDRVVADLHDRLGLPTTTAFRGDQEVRLIAARPTFVAGQTGVTFVYTEGPDRILTLTLLPGREIQMPRQGTTQIETYRPFMTRKDSIGIVVWKQADIAYALTAPASEVDLSRLFLKIRKAKPQGV
jgi:anti-sigma factor RsiW